MNYAIELFLFRQHARKHGLDLSGDEERFFKLKTARAWTRHLALMTGVIKKADLIVKIV